MTVRLHSHAGRNGTPPPNCESPGEGQGSAAPCAVEIWPYDVGNTWWFGFAKEYDYRDYVAGAFPPTLPTRGGGERIQNFTEQRILRMIDGLNRGGPVGIDMTRVYVRGHSMGGWGALALATRYPEVFAAAHCSKPMTDYERFMYMNARGVECPVSATSCCGNCSTGTFFADNMQAVWGDPCDPIKAQSRFPNLPRGWGDTAFTHNGAFTVWEWQNHQEQLGGANGIYAARHADDMVPFGIVHGTADITIPWCNQGYPAYPRFNDGDRCLAVDYALGGHGKAGLSKGMPAPLVELNSTPFHDLLVRIDESVPGFSDPNGISSPGSGPCNPPGSPGAFSRDLEWQAGWNGTWGLPPDETVDTWRMDLRNNGPALVTVDLTPRRLQAFVPVAGTTYRWTNCAIGATTDCTYQTGESTPTSQDPVLVLEGVQLDPAFVHRIFVEEKP